MLHLFIYLFVGAYGNPMAVVSFINYLKTLKEK